MIAMLAASVRRSWRDVRHGAATVIRVWGELSKVRETADCVHGYWAGNTKTDLWFVRYGLVTDIDLRNWDDRRHR